MRVVRLYTDTSGALYIFRADAQLRQRFENIDGKLTIQFPVVILPTPDGECPNHLPADRSNPLTGICSAPAVTQDGSGTLCDESQQQGRLLTCS